MVFVGEEISNYDIIIDINTDKLIKFIDEYGVDFVDKNNKCLLSYLHHMNKQQIDVVMSNKPDLRNLDFIKEMGFLMSKKSLLLYIIEKMVESDDNFVLVNLRFKALHPWFRSIVGLSVFTCLEFFVGMCREKHGMVLDPKFKERFQKAIVMLENHEKKYYKLFDLLLKQGFY